jgi:hypothetical protein
VTRAETTRVRRAFGSLQYERDELRTALAQSHAMESIGRRLGDELIAAHREIVGAAYEAGLPTLPVRLRKAILLSERLVGRPHE